MFIGKIIVESNLSIKDGDFFEQFDGFQPKVLTCLSTLGHHSILIEIKRKKQHGCNFDNQYKDRFTKMSSNDSSFYDHFWSFLANPFNIFHKTEALLIQND